MAAHRVHAVQALEVEIFGIVDDARDHLAHVDGLAIVDRHDAGKLVPVHHIQTFTLKQNDRPLISGQLNTSISRNPLFVFKARQIKSGDTLSVHWTDNKGAARQDAIKVE